MQGEVDALESGSDLRALRRLAMEAQEVAAEEGHRPSASQARGGGHFAPERALSLTAKGSDRGAVAFGPQVLAAAPSADSNARQSAVLDEAVDGEGVAHRVGACTLVFLGIHPVAAVVAEALARAGAREFVFVEDAPVSTADVGVSGLFRAADVGASRSAVLATQLTGLTGGRARVCTVHASPAFLLSDYRTLLGRRVAPAAPARKRWGPLPHLDAFLRALGRHSLHRDRSRAREGTPPHESWAGSPTASRVVARSDIWAEAASPPAAVRRPKQGVVLVHCAEAPRADDEAGVAQSLVTAGRLARELDAPLIGVRWPLRDANKPDHAAAVVTAHVPRVTACPECPPLQTWIARGTHIRLRHHAPRASHRATDSKRVGDDVQSSLSHAASAVAHFSATARRVGTASGAAFDPPLTAGAAQAVGAMAAHCALAWVGGSPSAAGAVAVGLRDLLLRSRAGAGPRSRWALAHWSASSFHGPSLRCRAPDCGAPLDEGAQDGNEHSQLQ